MPLTSSRVLCGGIPKRGKGGGLKIGHEAKRAFKMGETSKGGGGGTAKKVEKRLKDRGPSEK